MIMLMFDTNKTEDIGLKENNIIEFVTSILFDIFKMLQVKDVNSMTNIITMIYISKIDNHSTIKTFKGIILLEHSLFLTKMFSNTKYRQGSGATLRPTVGT
jgi:hypothetical protein